MDFLDAVDRQDVAGRLAGKLVGAVRGADGDRQRVALGALHEVSGLGHIGQQHFAGHGAFGAVTIFLVALHGFQRTEHAQFRFHRHADGVRELDHFLRYFHVVVIRSDRFAVRFQRAVHHHRGEARADRRLAHCRRLAVVLVHDHRNVRVGFHRGIDQVAQKRFAGIFAGAGRRLHDDRAVQGIGGSHDGLHLLQIVDVERRDAIAVFSSMVQQLTHGYEGHGSTPNNKKTGCRTHPLRVYRHPRAGGSPYSCSHYRRGMGCIQARPGCTPARERQVRTLLNFSLHQIRLS